jgi:hypothetical protein
MSKKCSGCSSFLKIKNLVGNSGICQDKDVRSDEDNSCGNWKAIPYNRKKLKRKKVNV